MDDPAGVTAELESVQPFEDRRLEAPVVHDAVPLVAGQLGGGVERVLTEEIGIGRLGLDGVAYAPSDLGTQLVRTKSPEHVRDIDPPTVDGEWLPKPTAHDRIRAFVHLGAQPRAAVVELGQRPHAEPRFVVVGALAEDEVVGGRRARVRLRGQEPRMLDPDVVGRDVEHQPDVTLAGRAPQRDERGVATEMLGDAAVVDDVVPVVRASLEDRVEIDRVDAEVDQVVEVVLDPGQVAAIELDQRAGISDG